jgi:MFS family permease
MSQGRLYYGWPMLLGLSVAETVSWGVLHYAFSVFIRPMEEELGWSRATVTGAFSLALLVSGLSALPVGHWLDRHGPRALMSAGSVAGALLLFAWSRAHTVTGFYLIWAGLGMAMAAMLYEPAFVVVATWFVRQRHRALTLLTVFGGLASAIFVPLSAALLARQGWRGAVATLGLFLLGITLPIHALLLRRHPREVGAHVDGGTGPPKEEPPAEDTLALRDALRSRAFRSLATTFALGGFASAGALVHLVPFLLERGDTPAAAAALVGLLGMMQLPARFLYGSVRRVLATSQATALVFAVQAVALLALPWLPGAAGSVLVVTLLGMGNGMATQVRASAVAETFGTSHYGRISGALALLTSSVRAAAPVLAALAYTASGYAVVFAGLALLAGGAALVPLLPLPARRPRPADVSSRGMVAPGDAR